MLVRMRPRQAVSTLLWGVISCAALLFAAEFVFPRWLELDYDRTYVLRRDRLARRLEPPRIDAAPLVVVLGSSRTTEAWHGSLAEHEFNQSLGRQVVVTNFASPGNGPVNHLVMLGRLLRDGLRPDLVLLEILPAQLHRRDSIPVQALTNPLSPRDREWLREHDLSAFDGGRSSPSSGPALWRYRTDLLRRYLPKWASGETASKPSYDDWGGKHGRHVDSDPTGKGETSPDPNAISQRATNWARFQYAHLVAEFHLGGPNLRAVESLLAVSRQHGIRVALVISPEGPEFRSWYRPGAREEFARELHSLATRHDAELLNAWEWLEEGDFTDSHHTTGRGRHRFTTQVCQEIVAKRWLAETRVARGGADSRR